METTRRSSFISLSVYRRLARRFVACSNAINVPRGPAKAGCVAARAVSDAPSACRKQEDVLEVALEALRAEPQRLRRERGVEFVLPL